MERQGKMGIPFFVGDSFLSNFLRPALVRNGTSGVMLYVFLYRSTLPTPWTFCIADIFNPVSIVYTGMCRMIRFIVIMAMAYRN